MISEQCFGEGIELIPPFFRDSKLIMGPLFKLAFKDKAHIFLNFRRTAFQMTNEEYADAYHQTASCNLLKGSDLNLKCKNKIIDSISGTSVLDVGCGRGELLNILNNKLDKTG